MGTIHPSPGRELAKFTSLYRSAIGIDVHCQALVCCHQAYDPGSETVTEEIAEFGTSQSQLLEFAQWCHDRSPSILLMESTGVLWNSPYEALEDIGFTQSQLALVNARDVKIRKGHKTDRNDAQHLAELARLGSFRKSFVLDRTFRNCRLIARSYCTTKAEFAREKNRYQKMLNSLGNRASSVFSDVNGMAARKIITAYIQDLEPIEFRRVVESNCKRLKASAPQILDAFRRIDDSDMRDLLRLQADKVKSLETQCSQILALLRKRMEPHSRCLKRLTSIPGIQETSALLILAEIGTDLTAFPGIEKFCSWMGICPGNKISAGKSYSGSPSKGNRYLRQTLTEVANGVALSRRGYLWQKFQAWKERRGRNRAIIAIAHLIARIIYVLLTKKIDYVESEDDVLREHHRDRLVKAARQALADGFVATGDGILDRKTGELIPT